MLELLAALAGGLALASVLTIVVLVVRRVWVARAERDRRIREDRMRPVALALLDGELEEGLETLDPTDLEALATLLLRYGRALAGGARERIAAFCESEGLIDREVAALHDRRAWRRAKAAFALGDMASRRAGPALLRALSDGERDVRTAAARSLGRLGIEGAAGPLTQALAERAVPVAVVGQALLSLGVGAAPRLRTLLTHESSDMRAAATELLGLAGDAGDAEAVAELVVDPAAEVRAQACRALARLGAEDAVAELKRALSDRIPFVRTQAARALGAAGDAGATPLLVEQARDDAYEPAHAAAQALTAAAPDALMRASAAPDASSHLREAADLLTVRDR